MNTQKSSKPITLHLPSHQARKLRLIQEAITEPTTYDKIINGLLDIGYANAIKTLHQEGRLSNQQFHQAVSQLPDGLQAQLKEGILN